MQKFMICLAVALSVAKTGYGQSEPDFLLTKDEAALLLKMVGPSLEKKAGKKVGAESLRNFLNDVLKNKDVRAGFEKAYGTASAKFKEPGFNDKDFKRKDFGVAKPTDDAFRDYVVQAFVFFALTDDDSIKKYTAEIGRPKSEFGGLIELSAKGGDVSDGVNYAFVTASYSVLTPVKIASVPPDASVLIDDVPMKKPTDGIYLLSKVGKRKVSLSLDKYQTHEEKEFDANKSETLKVTLKAK